MPMVSATGGQSTSAPPYSRHREHACWPPLRRHRGGPARTGPPGLAARGRLLAPRCPDPARLPPRGGRGLVPPLATSVVVGTDRRGRAGGLGGVRRGDAATAVPHPPLGGHAHRRLHPL